MPSGHRCTTSRPDFSRRSSSVTATSTDRRSPGSALSAPPITILTSALLLLMLLGCGDRGQMERFQVIEEDGRTVAVTHGGPLYKGNLFTVEPIVQLRQDPDRPETLLYSPGRFHPGPNGEYLLEDRGNGRIAVFGPDGSFVRSFGRKGEGPGEFRMMTIESVRDGKIIVFDYQLQRASVFSLDGSFDETLRLSVGGSLLSLDRLPDGRLVVDTVRGREEGHIGYHQRKVTVYAPGGADTLAHIASPETQASYVEAVDENTTFSTGLPFSGSSTALSVPGHGIAVYDGYTPEITWYDYDGSVLRQFRMEIPGGPLSDELKSAYEDRMRRRLEQLEAEGRQLRPARRQYYPDRVGIWSRVMADEHGWLWLLDARAETMHEEGTDFVYHVVDADGRYLGATLLPARMGVIRQGNLHALLEDPETGETVPTVLRLTPTVEGLVYPPE